MSTIGAMATSDTTAASLAMHENDDVAHDLGIDIVAAEPGTATVEMTVTASMTNGLDVCHGGIIFVLADTAMAHASNAAGDRTLSTSASIEWLRAVRVGERLVATSSVAAIRGRNTVHDVVVAVDGERVALLRGQTLTLRGS